MNITSENITGIIAIIGIFLIFSGVLKMYFYYRSFNISIIPYIEIDEVIGLFFDNLFLYLGFSFIISLISFDFYYYINIDQQIQNIAQNHSLWNRIFYYYQNLGLSKFLILPILVFSIIYYKLRPNPLFYESILLAILSIFIIYLLPVIPVEIKIAILERYKFNVPILSIFTFELVSFLCVFSCCISINEAYKVKKLFYFKNVDIFFNKENDKEPINLIGSNQKYYIGKTKNYFFIYDSLIEKTEIYPISKLSKITRSKNEKTRWRNWSRKFWNSNQRITGKKQ